MVVRYLMVFKPLPIMKYFLLFFLFLSISVFSFAQPDNIKRLMDKMQAGKELTEAEEQAMVKWAESMDDDRQSSGESASKPVKSRG